MFPIRCEFEFQMRVQKKIRIQNALQKTAMIDATTIDSDASMTPPSDDTGSGGNWGKWITQTIRVVVQGHFYVPKWFNSTKSRMCKSLDEGPCARKTPYNFCHEPRVGVSFRTERKEVWIILASHWQATQLIRIMDLLSN